MGLCFSGVDNKQVLAENREMIEANARTLSVCRQASDGELYEKVSRLYDAVRYMTPCAIAAVIQVDKRIRNKSDDLKIALAKNSTRGNLEAEDIINELNMLIAERNSYTA